MKRNNLKRVVGLSLAAAFALALGTSVHAAPKYSPGVAGLLKAKGKPNSKSQSPRPRRIPGPSVDENFYENGKPAAAKVALGKTLFFDKIISGNLNISCATCHHPMTGTSDGLSLPIGEGAAGLSVTRDTGAEENAVHERVPRNAPAIFNLGAREFENMFHDGRVSPNADRASGFDSPAGDKLPEGLDSVLAVQAMFPVTSATEMAGQAGENSVADAAAIDDLAGPDGVWAQLADRLRDNPEYVEMFKEAFPHVESAADITFVDAANAIAAFEAVDWRADNSPFDRFLRGDRGALSLDAVRGMGLFYGKAGCAKCHSGTYQTDQDFHAIAMPQVGPGKGDGESGREDFGLERVTGDEDDRYKFRTPTLRNVALTGPWGHAGAYNSLEAVVRHHLNPVESLENYDASQLVLPYRADLSALDMVVQNDAELRGKIAAANELRTVELSDGEIKKLMSFLHALTDPSGLDLRKDVPARVPSGLPLFD